MTFVMKTYNPFPITVSHAKGIYIYDKSGNRFIDTFSGIGVLNFGHSNDEIIQSVCEKLKRYSHLSNFFKDPDIDFVSETLIKRSNSNNGKIFFTNSGAESIETAIKAIHKYKKGKIISFVGNFHGRTYKALSITGMNNIRTKFVMPDDEAMFLPHNNYLALEHYFKLTGGYDVAAVVIEPILGSGGIKKLTSNFVKTLIKLRKKYRFILLIDEIQAGLGRTGKFYAHQNWEHLNPDIITIAKSIGGGIPLGATIFFNEFSEIFSLGEHGSTFAPNPLALAAAKIVLKKLTPELLQSVKEKGNYLLNELKKIKSPIIKEVRGLGLMLGIEIVEDKAKLIKKIAFQNKLLLNITNKNVIRLLPPLNINYQEIDEILEILNKIFKKI